jgi:hypothetical protein
LGGLEIEATSSKNEQDFISTNKLGLVVHDCHPSSEESANRRISIQVVPGKNVITYLKNN